MTPHSLDALRVVRRSPAARFRLPALTLLAGLGIGYALHHISPPMAVADDQVALITNTVIKLVADRPELITDALAASQAKAKRQREDAVLGQLEAHHDDLYADPMSPVAGNPAGDVTIVEFFDYRCPYCRASAPALDALLAADPGVKVIFKDLPILGPDSIYAAHLMAAAADTGKFAPLHHAMLSAPAGSDHHGTRDGFDAAASGLGLSPDALYTASRSLPIDDEIKRTTDLARDIGVTGTPAWVIGDRRIDGGQTLAQLTTAVAAARTAAARR
jgi:protein-disulfide isomerase